MIAVSTAQPVAKNGNATHKLARVDIAVLAEKLLHDNPYHVLKNIHCDVEGTTLVLRGSLPSYFLKQMAQETVVTLSGVTEIVNLIEVVAPS